MGLVVPGVLAALLLVYMRASTRQHTTTQTSSLLPQHAYVASPPRAPQLQVQVQGDSAAGADSVSHAGVTVVAEDAGLQDAVQPHAPLEYVYGEHEAHLELLRKGQHGDEVAAANAAHQQQVGRNEASRSRSIRVDPEILRTLECDRAPQTSAQQQQMKQFDQV